MNAEQSSRRRRAGPAAVLVVAALVGGCGGSGVQPVDGKVVWDDGAPATELAGSHVIFDLPEQKTTARGIIQPDGSFKLTTNKPDDGALAGDYKVLIVEAARKPKPGGEEGELMPTVMDSRYSDPSTSDLVAKVTSGSNTVVLKVTRAPK